MKTRHHLSVLLLSSAAVISCANGNPSSQSEATVYPLGIVSLIPQPNSMSYGGGNVAIPEIRETPDTSLEEEEYTLDITAESINITYGSDVARAWAHSTLDQIIGQQTEVDGVATIPQLSIRDKPRYGWRGFHLDVARHMFSPDVLKKVVDCLSFYKINHFHIHLCDDQGWRIEIKKYPELTSEGAWRKLDNFDAECRELEKKDSAYAIDPAFLRNSDEYGGYYTQEQLKELVAYAAERGIDVIPEIDLPGHLTSAIKCYPSMQCNGETGWGEEFSYPICAGRDENVEMFRDIFDEVMDIFPGKYIHIGADEVNKDPWETCQACQKKIRDNNLSGVEELCNFFVRQIADYLKSKGKTVMAWDDAFYAKDPQDLVYTFWRDWIPSSPAAITGTGHKMVFMEWGHFYFSARPGEKRLKELYNYSADAAFPGINRNNMLGYQACIWTETIPNATILGRHMFPSLQALSELGWTKKRVWDSFVNRLPWHVQWVEDKGFTPGLNLDKSFITSW